MHSQSFLQGNLCLKLFFLQITSLPLPVFNLKHAAFLKITEVFQTYRFSPCFFQRDMLCEHLAVTKASWQPCSHPTGSAAGRDRFGETEAEGEAAIRRGRRVKPGKHPARRVFYFPARDRNLARTLQLLLSDQGRAPQPRTDTVPRPQPPHTENQRSPSPCHCAVTQPGLTQCREPARPLPRPPHLR